MSSCMTNTVAEIIAVRVIIIISSSRGKNKVVNPPSSHEILANVVRYFTDSEKVYLFAVRK